MRLYRTVTETFRSLFVEFVQLIGLSGVAIMYATLITAIVALARSAIRKGVNATSKFAKALKEVSKKLAPFLGSFLRFVGTIASLRAKGIS